MNDHAINQPQPQAPSQAPSQTPSQTQTPSQPQAQPQEQTQLQPQLQTQSQTPSQASSQAQNETVWLISGLQSLLKRFQDKAAKTEPQAQPQSPRQTLMTLEKRFFKNLLKKTTRHIWHGNVCIKCGAEARAFQKGKTGKTVVRQVRLKGGDWQDHAPPCPVKSVRETDDVPHISFNYVKIKKQYDPLDENAHLSLEELEIFQEDFEKKRRRRKKTNDEKKQRSKNETKRPRQK